MYKSIKNPRFLKIIITILILVVGFFAFKYFYEAFYKNSIQSFNVSMNVQENNEILITETIIYDFGYERKKGIERNIPLTSPNNSRINISVSGVIDEVGNQYKYNVLESDNILTITIGDADNLITGIKTYRISYKVSGAVAIVDNFNKIHWNVTGDQWMVPIKNSAVSITLPGQAVIKKIDCFTGQRGSLGKNCTHLSSETNETTNITFALTKPLKIIEGFAILLDYKL